MYDKFHKQLEEQSHEDLDLSDKGVNLNTQSIESKEKKKKCC